MTTINVMAPLVVGDPADPNGKASAEAWKIFDEHLASAKALGVTAVTTDVWWGLVEEVERVYVWTYYDKLAKHIIAAGLKWIPIISIHRCGGNIGDDVTVNMPKWVWSKVAKKAGSDDPDYAKYKSEQGNICSEYVACWLTDHVLEDYIALFTEFQKHFAPLASDIVEVNISLGPAGELRFPSYNSHDKNTDYPTRGGVQWASAAAAVAFAAKMIEKYGDMNGVRAAWGEQLEKIELPSDLTTFFRQRAHLNTQYGRDVFDWYSDSLLTHGRKVMTAALNVFSAPGAAFAGIDIGAKVPGVHWYLGYWSGGKQVIYDRLAELAAGLLKTSTANDWQTDEAGRGYRPIVTMFKELGNLYPQTRVVLHFTCLEMPDPKANWGINSLAHSLVVWLGQEAHRQGVPIKGENALALTLPQRMSWELMRSVLVLPGQDGPYEGLTLLRMSDCVTNNVASSELRTTCELASRTNVIRLCRAGDDRVA